MQQADGCSPRAAPQRGWRLRVKRAQDLVLAGGALLASAPLMLGTAAAIRLTLGRPVLFRQRRPGLHGVPFEALKFRTMREAVDAVTSAALTALLADRLTAVGRVIRRLSLDELPQLLNVLRGEMSLVGPRPLLMRYLPRYSPEQRRRHDVLPGITGWAQVTGRTATPGEERFAQDLYYVDHWSLSLDAQILLRTVAKVVRGSGVSQPGQATMQEFMG